VRDDLVAILDVGKTLAKLTLLDRRGRMLWRRARPNARSECADYAVLDVDGIEAWLVGALAEAGRHGPVGAIVPVGHGAAAAVLCKGRLAAEVMDYEDPGSAAERAAYDAGRDPFTETGSPSLPGGLNLGFQLHRLEHLRSGLMDGDAAILPWPQFWAWRLCGVAASEITSLGCHTDLWRPDARAPSAMAVRRGWAERFAPMRRAHEVLGTITPAWAALTGLPATVEVHCGLHDSNAALTAARAFPEIAGREATVLSTGTWFVAMRTPDGAFDTARLDETRDCLVNVDAAGRAVPSARIMGGREIEILTGVGGRPVDIKPDQPALIRAAPRVAESGAMVLPTFSPGVGPFPHRTGRWVRPPADDHDRRAAASLYAALVADAALSLIGARDRILVEGRFADAEVFVRGLASLRPSAKVYVSHAQSDVAFGALRLLEPGLAPTESLVEAAPLDADLGAYAKAWREKAEWAGSTA
jgi:sugar (pentulose or hexulose) kinase